MLGNIQEQKYDCIDYIRIAVPLIMTLLLLMLWCFTQLSVGLITDLFVLL